MQFITGRVVIVGNKEVIDKGNYQFMSVILVIKKKMNGKMRNIAFECVGKLAEEVSKLNSNEKIEVKYLITSAFRNQKWYTNLQAKEIFRIEKEPRDKNKYQLKIQGYDNTFEKSSEG